MRIAYFASPKSIHDCKWINHFSQYHTVFLFCYKEANFYPLLNSNVTLFEILPETYPFLNFLKRFRIVKQIKKKFFQHNIEMVHSMYAVPNAFWAFHSGHKNHIITTRGSDILKDYTITFKNPVKLKEKLIFPFLSKLLEKALDKANYITSTSRIQQKIIQEFVTDPNKLIIIRTGVDVTLLASQFRNKIIVPNQITILCPRGLNLIYNIDLIIDVFNKMIEIHPQIIFRLKLINYLTNDVYLNQIIKKIEDYHLTEVIEILPAQDSNKMGNIYLESDIVLMLPKSDGTPVTGIEAMLFQTPLVLGPIPYDEDLFNNKTVWKTESFTEVDICAKISEVINCPEEEKQNKLLTAYQAALHYADFSKETKKIEQLYRKMVGKNE